MLTNNPEFTRWLKPTTYLLWLLLCLVSPAWGLGMGEISLKSFLGEPLEAKIDLLLEDANDYSLENIRVRQIGPAEAGKLGFELIDAYYGIRFQPVEQGQQWYIDLTSSKPVNEPYINLLVEVRWPKGTVYREYTVLVDPPVAPVVSVAGSGQSVPVPRQPEATTVAPFAATARTDIVTNSYQVQSGDSLYAIARRTESRGDQSLNNMMDWIVQNNPQAFVGGDRNRLKAGVGLTLPTHAQLLSARQVTPVVAESVLPAVPSPEPAKTPEAAVKKSLLSLEEGEAISNNPLDTDAVESLSAEVIRAKINGAQESNEKLMRENKALRQHMAMLEASDYVGNLEKLIALKDQQIATLASEQEQLASKELSAQAPVVAIDPVQRPSLLPVATDAAELSSSNKGWWAFYAAVIASLLGFLFYFLRNRKSPEEYSGLTAASFKPGEEEAMLEELDDLANQFHAGDQLVDEKDEPTEQSVPDFVGKATGGRSPRSVQPGRDRRPDDEVKRDIEKRIQGYSPNDSKRVMQVPERHDEVDHIISEALAYITVSKFDLAEGMLLEADFESGGKEGRLTDALEYLSYCRNAKGNRSAS